MPGYRYKAPTSSNPSPMKLPPRTRAYLEHGAPEGTRNDELFHAAGQFRDAGYSVDEAHGHLMPRAMADGLSDVEAKTTINSAYNHAARDPIPSSASPLYGVNGAISSLDRSREEKIPRQKKVNPPPESRPLPQPIPSGCKVLLETCFEQGDGVAFSDTRPNAAGERKPGPGDVQTREKWLEQLSQRPISEIYPAHRDGLFIRINPIKAGGKTDKDVTAFRHVLVEFDLDEKGKRIPKEQQYGALVESNLPCSAILDSGDKSIHAWVKVDAPDRQEYDRRRELVWEYFKDWNLDPRNKNVSRYSRCPNVERNLYDKDHNLIGHGRQALLAINVGASSFANWEKTQSEAEYTTEEIEEIVRAESEYYRLRERPLPSPMAKAAFTGILGEIVDIIIPWSEASEESIAVQLLIGIGNLIGRGARCKQAGIHHVNEFGVLVGKTAKGRKGTAWDAAQNLLAEVDPDWALNRLSHGYQSGESIIHAVRDEVTGPVPMHKRKAGQAHKTQIAVLDPGVSDKRLLIVEEEFARLLMVAGRTGNTLSPTLRYAWDGKKRLKNEGKISPEHATDAHISLIGHVTLSELLECLATVENKNGFSNRILWVATERKKRVSRPKWIDWCRDYPGIVERLKSIVEIFTLAHRTLVWSKAGEEAWDDFYQSIPDEESGIVGSIIARSDAHVLRLSMKYAILDRTTLMEPRHLEAAMAVWDYCQRSAQWVFGEKTGNKMADKIYWALERAPQGLTKQEIADSVFGRNYTKINLDAALACLLAAKLASFTVDRLKKGGRKAQRWFVGQTS
jgi:hypothetical protein